MALWIFILREIPEFKTLKYPGFFNPTCLLHGKNGQIAKKEVPPCKVGLI